MNWTVNLKPIRKIECHGFFSDGCHAESEHDVDLSYFQSLGYLQTVAFTIGYGHISPTCHSGKVLYCLEIQLFSTIHCDAIGGNYLKTAHLCMIVWSLFTVMSF